MDDKNLKTQIQFEDKDLENFTKEKGTEEQFRKTDLLKFIGEKMLPPFDHNIKWRKNTGKARRT